MQGSMAQTLGLAMHGNAFLQGRALGRFWPEATFFQFCRNVCFLAAEWDGGRSRERVVAADPPEWLRSLSGGGSLRVRVVARSQSDNEDMMTVGFTGGGPRWLIEEWDGSDRRAWSDEWSVTDPEAGDRRIWSVAYRSVPIAAGACPPPISDLDRSERELGAALEAIAEFARRTGSDFSASFEQALRCLRGHEPCQPPYHPDLAPPGLLSSQAQRILTACEIGWVFGGMGSWNDGSHGEEGDALSLVLFSRLQAALVDSVNSAAD